MKFVDDDDDDNDDIFSATETFRDTVTNTNQDRICQDKSRLIL